MTGLAPQTHRIYPFVAGLQCIKQYRLVGGTALSLQINHRLSEDLDFCRWVNKSSASNGIPYQEIRAELGQVFTGIKTNAMSFDQVDFRLYDVKVTFFNEVGYILPEFEAVNIEGISCMPVQVLCAMKIKTMFERTAFRDYYDVYSIISANLVEPEAAIDLAKAYDPKLQRRAIIKRLTEWKHFKDEKTFSILKPKYQVVAKDIGRYFADRFK